MSAKMLVFVARLVGIPSGAKAVLCTIASFARDDGTGCIASHETIGLYAGCTDRSAQEHIALLEHGGVISRHRRHGESGYRTTDEIVINVARIEATYQKDLPVGPPYSTGSTYRKNLPVGEAENGHPPTGKKAHHLPEEFSSRILSVGVTTRSKSKENLNPLGHRQPRSVTESVRNLNLETPGSDWSRFWDMYPTNRHRTDAKKAWVKKVELADDRDEIVRRIFDALPRHVAHWRDTMKPDVPIEAKAWLQGERWNDEIAPTETEKETQREQEAA